MIWAPFLFLFIFQVKSSVLPEPYELNLIHYNDFHARFEETSVATPTCRFNNNSCLGGFPRLYHEINVLLKEKPDSVLLNAGDSFQGTYWYTLLKWNVTQQLMNTLPHDAHALGNHEFDDGPEGLVPYLKHLNGPVVVANMDCTNEPSLQGLYVPHLVIERNHRKIGIIGLITPETKKLAATGGVIFTDPFEATRREVKALTNKGVDIIILLSHCGLDVDRRLAKAHAKYIDIIVGGHTHSLLWNGESPSGERIEGPYPVLLHRADDEMNTVLIVQASAFTKYLGNLTVYFDSRGKFTNWEGEPIFLDRSIEEDPDIKKMLEPYAMMVHEAERVAIGETKHTLSYEDCVYGECALGYLLTDAMVEYAKEHVNRNENYIAFMQRGGIKSTIPKGNITKGMIFEVWPYRDILTVVDLQGKYIIEALERSVSEAWDYDPFKGPWVLQVAGLHVMYNLQLPEGRRITSVTYGDVYPCTDCAITKDKWYPVIASNFLLDGGDGFSMFQNKRNERTLGLNVDILEDYIEKHSPIDINLIGRIEIEN